MPSELANAQPYSSRQGFIGSVTVSIPEAMLPDDSPQQTRGRQQFLVTQDGIGNQNGFKYSIKVPMLSICRGT